jgi:hypothetical protein
MQIFFSRIRASASGKRAIFAADLLPLFKPPVLAVQHPFGIDIPPEPMLVRIEGGPLLYV